MHKNSLELYYYTSHIRKNATKDILKCDLLYNRVKLSVTSFWFV